MCLSNKWCDLFNEASLWANSVWPFLNRIKKKVKHRNTKSLSVPFKGSSITWRKQKFHSFFVTTNFAQLRSASRGTYMNRLQDGWQAAFQEEVSHSPGSYKHQQPRKIKHKRGSRSTRVSKAALHCTAIPDWAFNDNLQRGSEWMHNLSPIFPHRRAGGASV